MNMPFRLQHNIIDNRRECCLHLLVDRPILSTIGYAFHKRLKSKDALEYLSYLMTFLRVYCCTYIAKSNSESTKFVKGDVVEVRETQRERERERERKIMEGKFRFSEKRTD